MRELASEAAARPRDRRLYFDDGWTSSRQQAQALRRREVLAYLQKMYRTLCRHRGMKGQLGEMLAEAWGRAAGRRGCNGGVRRAR